MGLKKFLCVISALALVPLVTSCATNQDDGATPEPDRSTPEEMSEDIVEVFPVDSGATGSGGREPRIFVAGSLESLQNEVGLTPTEPTSATEESATYIAAFWGEQRTGGYTVEVGSASRSEETVTVVLRLQEPPEGAIVTQAITYPYAVFGLSDVDPTAEFVFEDQDGERLDWPVRVV